MQQKCFERWKLRLSSRRDSASAKLEWINVARNALIVSASRCSVLIVLVWIYVIVVK